MPDVHDEKTYWLQVFNQTTWQEFLSSGGGVTGFRQTRWQYIQQLKPGDVLLCYLSGRSEWVGILEVLSEPYLDITPIWQEDMFPCRANVKLVVSLPPERAISIHHLKGELSILQQKTWGLYFINSPSKWSKDNGRIVEAAILAAVQDV
jgi:predicted RNA-binding protein